MYSSLPRGTISLIMLASIWLCQLAAPAGAVATAASSAATHTERIFPCLARMTFFSFGLARGDFEHALAAADHESNGFKNDFAVIGQRPVLHVRRVLHEQVLATDARRTHAPVAGDTGTHFKTKTSHAADMLRVLGTQRVRTDNTH